MMHAIIFSLVDVLTIIAAVLWVAVSEPETGEQAKEQ
jgi:hypothetical protein